jgi:hypothetical protein
MQELKTSGINVKNYLLKGPSHEILVTYYDFIVLYAVLYMFLPARPGGHIYVLTYVLTFLNLVLFLSATISFLRSGLHLGIDQSPKLFVGLRRLLERGAVPTYGTTPAKLRYLKI